MINIQKYATLGHADHGWLNARHHFSFANYYSPERMGFGVLLVVNDDKIKAGTGFDTHPHRNMEIITYIRQGAITHKDSQGNAGRIKAGNVQVMSAGTGIFHSEYNLESEDTILYQIWIAPNKTDVNPRWDQMEFPQEPVTDELTLLVSGDEGNALFIHQDAKIYGGRLNKGIQIQHPIVHQAYLLASDGQLEVNENILIKGDAAEITELSSITIKAATDAEVIVIDVPKTNNNESDSLSGYKHSA